MGVLVVQGGPGTGKTHTLAKIRRQAVESGAICLNASGFYDERVIRLGTLSQFTHAPGIPESLRSSIVRLVDRAASAAPSDHLFTRLLRDVVSEMVACAARQPLFLVIDDAHQMDLASQSCLLHIIRRVETHDITVALAFPRTFRDRILDPLEFVGIGARLIRTTTMPQAAVKRLLEERIDADSAAQLALGVLAISGGNPSLVTALVRDLAQLGPLPPEDAVFIGDGFRTAYLGSLVRHPHLAASVEALAVLGDNATAARVARMLDQRPLVTRMQLQELEAAGLLARGAFRHPAVAGFVLGSMDGNRLRHLYLRAGRILRSEGAPLTEVARYLVTADDTPDESQVRVLLYASYQLLLAGQTEEAVACLRLADRADLDDRRRTEVTVALLTALWWADPAAAEPAVRFLLAAARKGGAHCEALRLLATWLLWFGRRDCAREVLALIAGLNGPGHYHGDGPARDFQMIVGCLRPDLLADAAPYPEPFGGHRPHQRAFPVEDPADSARPHDSARDRDASQRHREPIDPTWLWSREIVAVLRLVWDGEMKLADRSCAELLGRMPLGGLRTAHALLTGLRAHIRWSLGDVRTALALATFALSLLPDHSWGIAIGLPLSVLINAYTVLGDPHRAADYLRRPVPPEMHGSLFGALYHMARGRRLLSAGQANAALDAFVACAPACDPSRARGFDLLGWRASAAEAHLALGQPEEARRMARAELLALDTRPTEARGRALMLLALLEGPEQRRAHLEEAEQALRPTGNRLSLASCLAQLSKLDLAEGNTVEARARRNEALELAHRCGVPEQFLHLSPAPSPVLTGVRPSDSVTLDATVPQRSGGPAVPNLSDAEWRVATLAAEGKSNRQIATELYITVSTVEQHLTRVYRKLKIRRRSDLPQLLLWSR